MCVTLSNKFDPTSCSDEDLNSVATLVGTKKYTGSPSGLLITITNTSVTVVFDTVTDDNGRSYLSYKLQGVA